MIERTNRIGLALSSCAVLACAILLVGPPAGGFTFLGGSLDLTQRDVRVFNNFTAPEANDNVTPEPSFPGALGAPLAIWKAAAEWGSEKHGDGYGDSTQLGGLGSGGANFDFTWQGLASSPGGLDDNICSEIPGTSAGVVAFCEFPISDGWRIRFYGGAAIWEDGPGPTPSLPFHKDLQGIATHELGHALGLDHTTFNDQQTMWPSASGSSNTNMRSIEVDDIAGVQALYGVKSPSKPRITTYSVAGNTLTITGASFDSIANDVWFTNGAPTADGTPLVVSTLPSSAGGTQITLTVPPAAISGDVLVRVPGTSGASLSNAFPFDPAVSACPEPLVYGTPKTTSIGTQPTISVSGRPRMSTNDFSISLDGAIAGANGILFSGGAQGSGAFQGGTLWVSRPYKRHVTFTLDFLGSTIVPMPVTPALIGTTRYFQFWFLDANDPFGVGLSNAVRVTFCP